MMYKEKGLTLIELLVVIAIIGILSGILYLAIKPKERADLAKDAKYKAAIDSMRFISGDVYSSDKSYENLNSDPKTQLVLSKLKNPELKNSAEAWAIKAELINGKWFCRDSSGVASEKATHDISDYKCD